MNIPKSSLKRVVIIGAGFAGLQIAKKLHRDKFQLVLLDKNNYHTFQPLLYQVATAGIEPDSIASPIRAMIKKNQNFYFRIAQVHSVDPKLKKICSDIGDLSYDYLIIATGSRTNFFGNSRIEQYALPMKTITEALNLRNLILQNFERALLTDDLKERERLMTFVIAGGGPTGVELAGALSELKNFILPKDYPDLDFSQMNIHLVQATPSLLDGMSKNSAKAALDYLEKYGVKIWLNAPVQDYDGKVIYMHNNQEIPSSNLIWAAGVKGALIDGFKPDSIDRNRLLVDVFNRVKDYDDIFAVGDIAAMKNDKRFPNAHPMTAQPAIQQGATLAKNLNCLADRKKMTPFYYSNRGSMAIIGRNKAVCDLPWFEFKGFFAWLAWMFVHLVYLAGCRNRAVALINWVAQYSQYNKSIRLIIPPCHRIWKEKKQQMDLTKK